LSSDLKELWRFRGLLWQLIKRDLKVRYKNSRLGFLWSIAPPLMQVACITFAFRHATGFAKDFDNYSAYVLVAMIPWTYFSTCILDSSQSILLMYGVIKKVYLPREIIPLSTAISNFIHFMLSWVVFFVYLFFYLGAPPLMTMLWFPYLILVEFMLVTGLSLLVSCLNVFYEDVKYMVSIFMGLALFVLPIMFLPEMTIYSSRISAGSIFSNPWAIGLYMFNPVTALINGFRKTLLFPPKDAAIGGPSLPLEPSSLILAGLISFGVLVFSYWYFCKRKWQFVERP
jgi:ABC-type polysaccharide/polyol phosphate export permease